MKILTVCSGLDFINYTRRASIEAIHKLNPDLDILLFNSVLNIRRKKNISNRLNFFYYHFWAVEKLRILKVFSLLEYSLRFIKWRSFFRRYEVIFFLDPNQYYLLPYMNKDQKLIYSRRELPIIKRANIILGISHNLCSYYFDKYYSNIPEKVKLWPNMVDLNLWDFKRWEPFFKDKSRPLIGLAGNINYVIDIELLHFVISRLPEYDFEIAGKLDLNKNEKVVWGELLNLPNVKYLGLIPYNEFPEKVIN